MKALTYTQAHDLKNFALKQTEEPTPTPGAHDLLVAVKAFSVNPVDYKVRSSRSSAAGSPVILGWDASGVVTGIGSAVTNFKVGDEVYYAGDLNRNGSYAEFQVVDARLVGRKPKSLSFAQAAALPLTTLTAWEALFEKGFNLTADSTVLIIGGAGGVGSMAIQLLKAKTKARVIATAARPETIEWCERMGADLILNHRADLKDELKRQDIREVDVIFSTTHTDQYLKLIPELLRPFGSLVLVDDPKTLDILPFKRKALSVHWEFMFAKSMNQHAMASQGEILDEVSRLIDAGSLRTTLNQTLHGLLPENVRLAHETVERATSVGKTVIEL